MHFSKGFCAYCLALIYLFSAANKAEMWKNLAPLAPFFPLFIVFLTIPMPYDTVSLCHSPEVIFKFLSGAVKAESAALLQQYSLQCVRL